MWFEEICSIASRSSNRASLLPFAKNASMSRQVDVTDSDGRSFLHESVIVGDSLMVDFLLEAGADPNLADAGLWTPLHFAAQEGNSDIVVALLRSGADVGMRDSFGNTPLFRAVFNFSDCDSGSILDALLLAGADPDAKNLNEVSPRILANRIAGVDYSRWFVDPSTWLDL